MRRRQVHRRDRRRPGGQVAHQIAAARRDADEMMVRLDVERRHVHLRVLPDLWIDEAVKGIGKYAFQKSRLRQGRVLVNGSAKLFLDG